MKPAHYVIAMLFLLPFVGLGQDCAVFKTGKFYVKDGEGNKVEGYVITRTKTKQIEHAPNGVMLKSKVVWTSDCTYQLIHLKSKNYPLPKGTVTNVKIIRTFEGGYTGSGNSNVQPEPRSFTMYLMD